MLRNQRAQLKQIPRLATARPGYDLQGDTATPALVLAFHPPRPAVDLSALSAQFGVPVRAANASPREQVLGATAPSFVSAMAQLLDPEAADFAPPARGSYKPPTGPGAPSLDPVEGDMTVTVCASPDAGWPVLRDFFREGVGQRLTVAMYDFTAPHVEQALLAALEGTSAQFRLVLDGQAASGNVGGTGVNGSDRPERDVMADLRAQLGARFEPVHASVGAGGAVPSAYHIKVAVADGQRMWLSTGNWQSSNLAPFDFAVPEVKPPLPLTRYNRDYHVVVHNAALAQCYAGFIEYDATLGNDFAAPQIDEAPMLLVPDELEIEDFAPIKRFPPLTVNGQVKVTPLLTPDKFPLFVNELLAAAGQRVWIQNQYIQPRDAGNNFPEFEKLIEVLGMLAQKPGFDLRLCLRGAEEADRDRLLAAGIPPSRIRTQSICHAKLIVVDDDRVVVGSQNLSNDGFVANRDASLAFEHAGITAYFAGIFEEDWQRASPIANNDAPAVRVAAAGELAPPGFTKVPWASVYDTPPPAPILGEPPLAPIPGRPPTLPIPGGPPPESLQGGPTQPASIPAPAPSDASMDLPMFGVEADTGRRTVERSAAVAAAMRANAGFANPERTTLGRIRSMPSFGLGPGVDGQILSDVGWGVIWAPAVSNDVKAALRPLLDRRKAEAGDALFKEFTYVPGETARAFLQRNKVDFGSVRAEAVPYYLLLVGGPEEIPFEFQSVLDVEYRVGRLDLVAPEGYTQYATSVVAVEAGSVPARQRVLHTFGPSHAGDAPTALSVDVLVRAADGWLETYKQLTAKHQLSAQIDAGDAATKDRLTQVVRGVDGRPEVLFTAGHGLLCGAGSPRQPGEQGALVTADWDGVSPIDQTARFAAGDLPMDADMRGLVVFLFACFGAGTPATDSFPTRAGQPLAPKAFMSALPRAMLAHPTGAPLGVFGHVDRTLTWSLKPPDAPVATDPFARAALHVLSGDRLGTALDDLNERGATLAATVANDLRVGGPPIDDVDLVRTWTQQRDAAAFLLLGDPAARLLR